MPQNVSQHHSMKITMELLQIVWLACSLFTILIIASVDAALNLAINAVCRTSDSLAGTCIPLPSCPRLYGLYSQPRPLPTSTVQLLRSEQCGTLARQPLVCCRVDTPVTTAAPVLESRISGDVSSHRNIGLINPELCGHSIEDRIIGGNKTGVFEMPWMALLKYSSRKGKDVTESFKCGGTLINSRYVLTAAHCISNTSTLRLLSVRLGDHDISKDEDCQDMSGTRVCAPAPQNLDVESFVRHPRYNATSLLNDIALIRLAGAADVSKDNINPICLPVGGDAQMNNFEGEERTQKLIVAGWGITESGSQSPDLLKVSLPVMPTENCRTVFQKFQLTVTPNQLCAGGTNLTQDSCRGDSGGPLKTFGIINGDLSMIQYGVVSYGHRHCGTEGVPGVYTKVGPYMSWILDNIKP